MLVGSIALVIDASLRTESFEDTVCVYGFDLNAPSVLKFVRDGLYSKSLGTRVHTLSLVSIYTVPSCPVHPGMDASV